MIAKKYWIPVVLIVVLISSLVITPYLPLEWMCGTNSTEYIYHGFCLYGSGPMGWMLIVPLFSILGLALWFIVFLALLLFDKFKKRKKKK